MSTKKNPAKTQIARKGGVATKRTVSRRTAAALQPLTVAIADELLQNLADSSEFDFFMEVVRPDLRVPRDWWKNEEDPRIDGFMDAQKVAEWDVVNTMRAEFRSSVTLLLMAAAAAHSAAPTPGPAPTRRGRQVAPARRGNLPAAVAAAIRELSDNTVKLLEDNAEMHPLVISYRPELDDVDDLPEDNPRGKKLHDAQRAEMELMLASAAPVIRQCMTSLFTRLVTERIEAFTRDAQAQAPTPAIQATDHAGHWLHRAIDEGNASEIRSLVKIAIDGGGAEGFRAAGFTDETIAEIADCEQCLNSIRGAVFGIRFPKEAQQLAVAVEEARRNPVKGEHPGEMLERAARAAGLWDEGKAPRVTGRKTARKAGRK